MNSWTADGSAAKFIATTCYEIALDTAVYRSGRVTVMEIMGRDAGCVAAFAVCFHSGHTHTQRSNVVQMPGQDTDITAGGTP